MPVTVQLNRSQQKKSSAYSALVAASAVVSISSSSVSSVSDDSAYGSMETETVPAVAAVAPVADEDMKANDFLNKLGVTLVQGQTSTQAVPLVFSNSPAGVPQIQCTFSLTDATWQMLGGAQVPVAQLPVAQLPVAQVPVAQVPVAQLPVAQLPVAQLAAPQVPEAFAQFAQQFVAPATAAPQVSSMTPEAFAQFAQQFVAPAAPAVTVTPAAPVLMQVPAEWTLPGAVSVASPFAKNLGMGVNAATTPEEAFRMGELNQWLNFKQQGAIVNELQARNLEATGNLNLLMKGDKASNELFMRFLTGALSQPAGVRSSGLVKAVEGFEQPAAPAVTAAEALAELARREAAAETAVTVEGDLSETSYSSDW